MESDAESPSTDFSDEAPIIEFVGVWDTVDAIGTPSDAVTAMINELFYGFQFPDQRLSHRVRRGYHALAIDIDASVFSRAVAGTEAYAPENLPFDIDVVDVVRGGSSVRAGYGDALRHFSKQPANVGVEPLGLFRTQKGLVRTRMILHGALVALTLAFIIGIYFSADFVSAPNTQDAASGLLTKL